MTDGSLSSSVSRIIKEKPVQATKFGGILLALTLAIAGFFRVINVGGIVEGPAFGDSQFLALVLLPLVSLGLVLIVFIELLVSGYQSVRSDHSLGEQVTGRVGYLGLRGLEAGLATLGVVIIATAVPPLLVESTPAPAGVGLMLLLFAVGLGIFCVSLLRSAAELFVYRESP